MKKNNPAAQFDYHQNQFIKLLESNSYKHRPIEVFRDFCEMSAISISNAVDVIHREVREVRYMELIRRYSREEIDRFPIMLGHIVESLELGFKDCLGELFMSLGFGYECKGQFFTPYPICQMMAKMSFSDIKEQVEEKGFIRMNEPACGAGALVIASAESMKEEGINYQQCLHVVAQDIDDLAVQMAYIQLSLFHVPALVIHGNSLNPDEVWSVWKTPAHIMGLWDIKLRSKAPSQNESEKQVQEQESIPLLTAVTPFLPVVPAKPLGKEAQMSLF